MDTKTLMIIVITAVVTTVTKLVTSWALKLFSSSALAKTLSATVKKWLIKEVVAIAVDFLALTFLAWLSLELFFGQQGAATKQDVFNGIAIAFGLVFFGVSLAWDYLALTLRRLTERNRDHEQASSL